MKQRKLEMLLEEIEGFSDPERELEQYQHLPLAAEVFIAYIHQTLA